REPDAGIAGGSLHNQAARLDLAALLRLEDNLARRPVLHRLSGIHELGLAQDGAAGGGGRALELGEGRIGEGFDHTVGRLHGVGSGPFLRAEPSGPVAARQGARNQRSMAGNRRADMGMTRRKLIGAMARLGGAGAAYETLAAWEFLKPPSAKAAS